MRKLLNPWIIFVFLGVGLVWYYRWPIAIAANEFLPGNPAAGYLQSSIDRQIEAWERRTFDGCYGDRVEFNFRQNPDMEVSMANIHLDDYLSFTLAPQFECGVVKKVHQGMAAGAKLCSRYEQLYAKDCSSILSIDREGDIQLTFRSRYGGWQGAAGQLLSQYDRLQ